ncbi:uncharacterized protein BDR25DRAFT_193278, partial [Lindgomyces ingoldianus]
RISAILPFAFAVVSFSLTLVLLIAGSKPGYLDEDFIISINASKVGQDIIRLEQATPTSTPPTSTASSTANPLDFLNPLSTSNPLNPDNPNNPLSGLLGPITGNITDALNEGIEDSLNTIVGALVDAAGVRDFYHLFLESICEGDATNSTDGESEVKIDQCSGYDDKAAGLNNLTSKIHSSIVIGTTNVSVPLIASLQSSFTSLSATAGGVRKAIIAFLIISMLGSGLAFLVTLPAIYFTESRILIYILLFNATLASTFHLLAAVILTGLIVAAASIVNGLGDAVGLHIGQGNKVLLFVWLGWGFVTLVQMYWFTVWFVEVRTWSFVRRVRNENERGNWRGVWREVWGDLKGRKG